MENTVTATNVKKTVAKSPKKSTTTAKAPKVKKAVVTPDPVIEPVVPVVEAPKKTITVVIPYFHSAAKGLELLYALRAWEKNFKEDFEILLIGDKPDFVADDVLHIEKLDLGPNPQVDVAAKLMQAIASHLVSDDFILTNDDIYPVNPITLETLKELRVSGYLGETKLKAGSEYIAKIHATKATLSAAGLTDYDFATHLPIVYNKSKLAEIIEKFKADTNGLLISSLYFNSNLETNAEPIVTRGGSKDDHIVYVYRENPRLEVIADGFENRKFANHNNAGYEPILPFLKRAFPDKSRFEKRVVLAEGSEAN